MSGKTGGSALCWQAEHTPTEVQKALRVLAEEYPIREGVSEGTEVRFQPGSPERPSVVVSEGITTILYSELSQALRGVGTALAGLVSEDNEYLEESPFDTFGFMLDCSRNAVMRPEHVKRWLRRLALLGFNMGMLYTEDTYEIPGEEYFGYQRGRYTNEELKDIDACAATLGIEMIGCIQTLGHLEQILRWPAYRDLRDSDSVLLAGDEKSYRLIAKMLEATAASFRSRRIHIGMDEAWGLGRGRYIDRFEYKPRMDVYLEHLGRVTALCRERGLEPMFWSDMLFVMGSPTGRYLDPLSRVLPEDAARIPKDVQPVYWDYYHGDREFYLGRIRQHREMGLDPIVASGIWTWAQLWYNRELTEPNAGAAIDACRAAKVEEIFFTLWGDDGAYCDFDSGLVGLAFVAERAFNPGTEKDMLERRFQAVCGANYRAVTRACDLTGPLPFAGILWDDPLLGIFHQHALIGLAPTWPDLRERFADLCERLSSFASEIAAGDIGHAALLADVLTRKIDLRLRLEAAYAGRDMDALRRVQADVTPVIDRLEKLAVSWRTQWLRRNKPFGLEVLQIRLAGQTARYRELATRLQELLDGRIASIPELDARLPHPSKDIRTDWLGLASGSAIL